MSVYIVGDEHPYYHPFSHIGPLVRSLADAKVAVFTGGEDVHPTFYGHKKLEGTYCNVHRDLQEEAIYHACLNRNIPMVGICRGAQFLNVMNDGCMIQHVDGHCMSHYIHTKDNRGVLVTSTHHQMMVPSRGYELIAWAHDVGFNYQWDTDFNVSLPVIPGPLLHVAEPEVIYYKETRCLCVQYHPEMMYEEEEGYQYFQELLERYI